jgi:release factor glutamine methyltransferase
MTSGTVRGALEHARSLGLDRLDAQLLLAHHLQRTRAWLLAHDEAALSTRQQADFAAARLRRADGEPLAYLLGEREFHGLMLRVTPAVLVPRPDTETLVDWALELLRGPMSTVATPEVADLGTGSGAIALAVKQGHARVRMSATDISAAAVEVARANASTHRLDIEFGEGDWWQPWPARRFHLVLSNPPYVAGDDPHLQALRHEPSQALTPGGDGLAAIAQLATQSPAHLRPQGWLLLEHGYDQAGAVRRLLHDAGFEAIDTRTDLAGHARCSGGRWPGDP